MLVACSNREKEQNVSPEVSTVDTIVTIVIDSTVIINNEQEPEPRIAEICKLVMNASEAKHSPYKIVFDWNGFDYTLLTDGDHELWVWKWPVNNNNEVDEEHWVIRNDSLILWQMKLPGTETVVVYLRDNSSLNLPEYSYSDEDGKQVALDSTQMEIAKSVENEIFNLQEELNSYLRKKFDTQIE